MRQMSRNPRTHRVFAAMLVISAVLAGAASTRAGEVGYPKRAIDAVVPISAGGATDTWTRTIMPYLSKKWGVPINVVNKPGGSGVIGTMAVLSAVADGYSVVVDGHIIPAVTAIQADCPFKRENLAIAERLGLRK